jgi:HAD superfamily hydrolase (TIGR01509 family)
LIATMIETVFLDAGGVLIFPNWTRVSAALAAHGIDVAPARLAAADVHARYQIDLEAGRAVTTDQQRGWLYFNLVLTHAGIPLSEATDAALSDLREYHAAWNLWEHVPDDVVPALGDLRRLGLRLVVVSNANGTLRRAFDRLELSEHVDFLLDSSDEGFEKPDPRLFHRALERANARAGTTLHVGDLYFVDVMGARAAGLAALLLDPSGLYERYDCPRIQRLGEVASWVETWNSTSSR